MQDILLIKYGELALKGDNRSFFENKLIKNIKHALSDFKEVKVEKTHGRIYVECDGDIEEVIERLKKSLWYCRNNKS